VKSEKLVLVEEEMVRNAEESPELEVKEMKKIVEEYKEDVLESRFSKESDNMMWFEGFMRSMKL